MAVPVLEPAAQELYDQLVPFQADEVEQDYALAKFCKSVASILEEVDSYAREGDNGEPGWSIILDINRAPLKGLAWLAQFVGVSGLAGLSEADQRARILSTDGWRRGTPASLIGAVRIFLTGTKIVVFRERDGSSYDLTVITYTQQTPSPALALAALLASKPGGIVLDYRVEDGRDYELVFEENVNYQDVFISYDSYQLMLSIFHTEGVYPSPGDYPEPGKYPG